jgi:hypothetical protein
MNPKKSRAAAEASASIQASMVNRHIVTFRMLSLWNFLNPQSSSTFSKSTKFCPAGNFNSYPPDQELGALTKELAN